MELTESRNFPKFGSASSSRDFNFYKTCWAKQATANTEKQFGFLAINRRKGCVGDKILNVSSGNQVHQINANIIHMHLKNCENIAYAWEIILHVEVRYGFQTMIQTHF